MYRKPACAALNVILIKKWLNKNCEKTEKVNEAVLSYGKDEAGPFTDDYMLKINDRGGCQVL